jgi:hypothetical protein
LISLNASFSLDEYREVFAVNVTSPQIQPDGVPDDLADNW